MPCFSEVPGMEHSMPHSHSGACWVSAVRDCPWRLRPGRGSGRRGGEKRTRREYPPGIYVVPNETIQEGIEGGEPVPGMLSLHPSANPFSSSVTITCEGEALPGQLMVYDLTGRLIRSLSDRQGSSFLWDGHDGSGEEVPTGTYLIQGAVEGRVSSLRVVKL